MSKDAASNDSLMEVPAEINSVLELLQENRHRLEAAMQKKVAFDAAHAESAGKLATAVKTLSTEARQWTESLVARASRATPEERTEAAIRHLSQLPQGPRLKAYRQLLAVEAQQSQPIRFADNQ